jgi:primosomal protein N'
LQEVRNPHRVAESLFHECPECGSQWSATCPFCAEPLRVMWRGHHAVCAYCHRQFHTPAAA